MVGTVLSAHFFCIPKTTLSSLLIFKNQYCQCMLCFLRFGLWFRLWFCVKIFYFIFFRFYFQKRVGREKESERNNRPGCLLYALPLGTETATPSCALTRNLTSNLLLSGMMPNQLEPHLSGQVLSFSFFFFFSFSISNCFLPPTPKFRLVSNIFMQVTCSEQASFHSVQLLRYF